MWFETLSQVDFVFGTVEQSMYLFYSNWWPKWLMRPLQRLAVDLLTKRRKRIVSVRRNNLAQLHIDESCTEYIELC